MRDCPPSTVFIANVVEGSGRINQSYRYNDEVTSAPPWKQNLHRKSIKIIDKNDIDLYI